MHRYASFLGLASKPETTLTVLQNQPFSDNKRDSNPYQSLSIMSRSAATAQWFHLLGQETSIVTKLRPFSCQNFIMSSCCSFYWKRRSMRHPYLTRSIISHTKWRFCANWTISIPTVIDMGIQTRRNLPIVRPLRWISPRTSNWKDLCCLWWTGHTVVIGGK